MPARELLPLKERGPLRNRLLEALSEARQARDEGRYEVLDELLSWLRSEARGAEGWSLALIEVALSAVVALAGTSLPPEEIALRSFLEGASEETLDLLARLLRFERVSTAERRGFGGEDDALWQRLETQGVVVPISGGYAINRRSHALVRDLIEPEVLRSWRQVEECRGLIAYNQLGEPGAVALLETRLGLSAGQARYHLARHPLTRTSTSPGGFRRPPWVRRVGTSQRVDPRPEEATEIGLLDPGQQQTLSALDSPPGQMPRDIASVLDQSLPELQDPRGGERALAAQGNSGRLAGASIN